MSTRDSFHRSATHAHALLSLGSVCNSMGDASRGIKCFEEAMALQLASGGKYSPVYATAIRSLASALLRRGECRRAAVLMQECVQVSAAVNGRSAEHADTLALQAEVLLKTKAIEPAIASLQECAAIRGSVLGSEHAEYLSTLQQLSALYVSSRRHAKAIQTLLEERAARLRMAGAGAHVHASALQLACIVMQPALIKWSLPEGMLCS
jgi:hypothetical protein